MKGLLFTEFLEMVETRFGYEVTVQMMEKGNIPDDRVYTSVGSYDHSEIVNMVIALSDITGIEVEQLCIVYGRYLFVRLMQHHEKYIDKPDSFENLLEHLNSYIHKEVKKLYPTAEVPDFIYQKLEEGHFVLTYKSSRKMWAVAQGLIEGALLYFQTKANISHDFLKSDGSEVKFTIQYSNE